MNRSRSKRITRKKVIPLHFQKNQASLSQILTTASYKRRVKELQNNNKVLAVALQDARLDLANSNKLLQRCSKDDAKILLAKAKLKDMVTCIQTLVTGLNEVMCCLDLKPIALFNCSQDEVKLKIRQPDLDTIEESNSVVENSTINASVLDVDVDAVARDESTTERTYHSMPRTYSPDNSLTPELNISFQNLNLHLINQTPKKEFFQSQIPEKVSPVKGRKIISRIPMREKIALESIEFSPPAPTRKTFVIKDAKNSSEMKESSLVHNSAQDTINRQDRRKTYNLASMTTNPTTTELLSSEGKVAIDFNEDMELTAALPIHNLLPTKNDTFQAFNDLQLNNSVAESIDKVCRNKPEHSLAACKPAPSKLVSKPYLSEEFVVSGKKNAATVSKENSFKSKCPGLNEDMELTCVIPVQNLPPSKNDTFQAFNATALCAKDNVAKSNVNIPKKPEHCKVSSMPPPSKLTSYKQDSLIESVVLGKENPATASDDSPKLAFLDSEDSKVIKELLKGRSICKNTVSIKTQDTKVSNPDSKENLSQEKLSSFNSKQTACLESPNSSRGIHLEAASENKLGSISKTSRKSKVSENKIDSKTSRKSRKVSDDESVKDDFKSFGRCTLKSPRKTTKRRGPYTFKKTKRSSRIQLNQSNDEGKVETIDTKATSDISSDCSTSFEINIPLPQNPKSTDISEKEKPSPSDKISPLLESAKSSNEVIDKSKCNSNRKSLKLKSSAEKTTSDNENVFEAVVKPYDKRKSVCPKRKSVCPKRKSKAVEVASDLALDVTSPSVQTQATCTISSNATSPGNKKSTVCSTVPIYRKSVQFAVNDCYDAFQGIKVSEPLINESGCNLNTGDASRDLKIKNSGQLSSSRSSKVYIPGILRKGSTSQQKLSKKISYDNSIDIENLPKHCQTEANKLDELLATIDSSFSEDSGCNTKNKSDHASASQPTLGDQVKRPFSGVSERRSKKRATDNSDVFKEIEAMCPQEISQKSLDTAQQFRIEEISKDCEETERYDVNDIINARDLKTLNSQDVENNIQIVQDVVNDNESKSSIQANKKVPCERDDITVLKSDKNTIKKKKCNKNVEIDILTRVKTIPLKTIQLPSTETSCTLNTVNPKVAKTPKKKGVSKPSGKSTTQLKHPVSPSTLTQIKKIDEISNAQNVQPSIMLEPLLICTSTAADGFTCSKDSTSLGCERPKRARSTKSLKEPSLNQKMRR